jgi:hypothetical protein
MRRPSVELALAWWACMACTGATQTDKADTDDDPDVITETCSGDQDCEDHEICDEDETCVTGDRDNEFDAATLLRFDEPRTGVIEPAGDKDFFTFETLSPGQWVLVETINEREEAEDLDTVVRIYQANGREHAAMDNYDIYRITAADSSLVAYLPLAGTWYVSVEDVATYYDLDEARGGSDFTYELRLTTFTATTSESGDPLLVELADGNRISRRGVLIDSEGDSDELVLRAPYDGEVLQVTATDAAGSALVADVSFSLGGDVVMRQPDLGTGNYGMVLDSVSDDYVVTVTDASGNGSQDHWTVLYFRTYEPDASVSFWGVTPYEPEDEPNDDRETAEFITRTDESTSTGLLWSGGFVEGRIDAEGDIDWYNFTIAPGNLLTVRCYADRFGSLVDLGFELLDGDGTSLQVVNDYDEWSAPQVFNVEGAEARYLRVFGEDAGFGPSAWYRCTLIESDWTVAE